MKRCHGTQVHCPVDAVMLQVEVQGVGCLSEGPGSEEEGGQGQSKVTTLD